jgi:hypothetical protein
MWTAAGERISTQEIFKKDTPKKVRALYQKHAIGNSLFRNSMFRNSGLHNNGFPNDATTFQDKTGPAGVGMGRWSWSSDAFDFDHDGFPDLYIANGMISGAPRQDLNSFFGRQVVANSPDQAKASHDYEQGWSAINELIRADGTWSGFERNVFYANNRDGTFSDISGAIGIDFIKDGRAFALADFDHDGRQEVFLKNRNSPQLRLLKNVMENLCRRRLPSASAARRVIVMPSARRSLWKRNRAARLACFKLDPDFFPSTARKYSSAWVRPKVSCAHRSAGRAGWCRIFTTFH